MSRVSSIIKTVSRKQDDNTKYAKELQPERERLDKYLEREEEEKYKDEGQKIHERYRRKQKAAAGGADLTDLIKPSKPIEQKPGTYFYGTLKKLGEDFNNDIAIMEKYFSLGQSFKFRPCKETNKIYCLATGAVLYDCESGESFE